MSDLTRRSCGGPELGEDRIDLVIGGPPLMMTYRRPKAQVPKAQPEGITYHQNHPGIGSTTRTSGLATAQGERI